MDDMTSIISSMRCWFPRFKLTKFLFADDPVPVPWPGPRQQQAKNNFKVVFLGKSGVGKTSITLRFCRDTFQDGTEATIGYAGIIQPSTYLSKLTTSLRFSLALLS